MLGIEVPVKKRKVLGTFVGKLANHVQPLSRKVFKSRMKQVSSLLDSWEEEDKENDLGNEVEQLEVTKQNCAAEKVEEVVDQLYTVETREEEKVQQKAEKKERKKKSRKKRQKRTKTMIWAMKWNNLKLQNKIVQRKKSKK